MKEKDMLKNMYEQSHSSQALDMNANEILSANLSHGARVKSRGFAGAAVFAVLAAVVGFGVYFHSSGDKVRIAEPNSFGDSGAVTSAQQLANEDKTASPATGFTPVTMEEVQADPDLYKDKVMLAMTFSLGAERPLEYYTIDGRAADELRQAAADYLAGTYSSEEFTPIAKVDYEEKDKEKTEAFYELSDSCYYSSRAIDVWFYDENGKRVSMTASLASNGNKATLFYYPDDEEAKKNRGFGDFAAFDETSMVYKALCELYMEYQSYYAEANGWDMARGDLDKNFVTLTYQQDGEEVTVLCDYWEDIVCDIKDWYQKYYSKQNPPSDIEADPEGKELIFYTDSDYKIGFYDKSIDKMIYVCLDHDKYPIRVVYCNAYGEPIEGETYYYDPTSRSSSYLKSVFEEVTYMGDFAFKNLIKAKPIITGETAEDNEKPVTKAPENEPAPVDTTATWSPEIGYTPDELKPFTGEVNLDMSLNAIVRFTRNISADIPQADMKFILIPEYTHILKGIYYDYKSGEITADTLTLENDPAEFTGGTWLSVSFKNDDGEMVCLEGIDINEHKAYARLTDGADDCATGKVFYFSPDNQMYKMLEQIWNTYYDAYEGTDSLG